MRDAMRSAGMVCSLTVFSSMNARRLPPLTECEPAPSGNMNG